MGMTLSLRQKRVFMGTSNTKVAGNNKPFFDKVVQKLWTIFASLQLVIFILLAIAFFAIFGTLIEQNKSEEVYVMSYGQEWTDIIYWAGLDNMYYTTWFTGLLAVLTINIIVCSIERFPPKWKVVLRTNPDFKISTIGNMDLNNSFTIDSNVEDVKKGLASGLKKHKYKIASFQDGVDHKFYTWKGRIGRFGPEVIHISILLILTGAIIGSIWGYRDFRTVNEGGSFSVPDTSYNVRLDNFWIDYYETGQVKQYYSMIAILEDGEEVYKKKIWVNEPMLHDGIRYYQASYGTSWNMIKGAEVQLMHREGEDQIGKSASEPVQVQWREKEEIPFTPYSVKVVGFVSDFAYDDETGTVYSQSAEATNPAVRVEIYKKDKNSEKESLVAVPWLFFNYPGLFASIPDTDLTMVLSAYQPVAYSGISINKDPGDEWVWVGAVLMGIGFIMNFFVLYKRVWVHIRDNGDSCEVNIGGTINKNKILYTKEFKDLVEELKSGLMSSTKGG